MKRTATYIALKEVGVDLLAEGKSLKVTTNGYSMYPSIKPFTPIVVSPTTIDDLVEGAVVAIKREDRLIVHRLKRIFSDKGQLFCLTRGDSNLHDDFPIPLQDVVGIVADMPVRKEISGARYLANNLTMRVSLIISKIKKRIKGGALKQNRS